MTWPDEESDMLGRRLLLYADTDFSGDVSQEEVLVVLRRLCEILLIPNAMSSLPTAATDRSTSLQEICAKVGAPEFKKAVRELLAESPGHEPWITLGPVIGKVTESQARILMESSHDVEISCTCSPPSEGKSVVVTQKLSRRRPAALKFDGLAPGTLYNVTVTGAKLLVDRCSFRTLPSGGWRFGEGRSPCFAVASCNCVYETYIRGVEQDDLWADLRMRLQMGQQVDYMLHLGDNVYLDADWCLIEKGKRALEDSCKWGVAHDWLKNLPPAKWLYFEAEIEEHFRNVYRETWGHRPTRWVLANIPNLMIFDDHDFRDDWGDRPEDRDENSIDRFLAGIAYRVGISYQRLLHDDELEPKYDYHMHVFGDVGLLFVDVRCCKSFHWQSEDAEAPMLGKAQWAAIDAALAPGGMFSDCKALLALVPEPIGYVSRALTKIMGNTVCDDLLGQWSAEAHRAEVPRFLQALKAWRELGSNKQVLILAGDVHEGGWTDLILQNVEGDGRIRQLTTSAIANKQTKAHEALAVALTRGFMSSLDVTDVGSGWLSRHYDWTNFNNYALVTVNVAAEGVLKVRVLKAEGIKGQDFLSWIDSTVDPYVKVSVGQQSFRTPHVCETCEPVWNSDEFEFAVQSTDHYVKLQVFDKDSLTGHDLGTARVAIHDLEPSMTTIRETLRGGRGTIEIEASFQPAACGSRALQGSDEDNSSRSTSDSETQVVLSAQLVIANEGKSASMTKKRGTSDPTFSSSKNCQNHFQEFSGYAGQMARSCFFRG